MQVKKTTLVALLIALASTAFAVAAVTLTNITEWHIQAAGTPPIVKVAGADAGTGLISVSTTTASDGTNRTVITIKGYTGDPTRYSEVIKICNKDTTKTYTVSLVYKGVISSGGWNNYVKYLTLWLGGYPSGPSITITSTTTPPASTGTVQVGPGICVPVSAEVLVDASTPQSSWNTDLMSIQIDVVSQG
ncbi:hypothetical protein [Thermofilum pendens]|uniref:Uncharacterized protein n=1 Tax=Thermofilum pendens (strain DSM 2475 / Hrk 5) TaxID=368408 RepID=A1S0E0_THEPD|nr:hypothetical protein [Thermofilum pendens]ABL78920.1 hypothetical protein Tpen_1524 [Thermofilum pendens Hrk 5]